jgi:hypothetical protein
MSYECNYDCDFEIKDMVSFIHINNVNKNNIINILCKNDIISKLLQPNKMQVEVQFIQYDNIVEVDYCDLYQQVNTMISSYDKLSYTDKQKLSNLIHYSKILE